MFVPVKYSHVLLVQILQKVQTPMMRNNPIHPNFITGKEQPVNKAVNARKMHTYDRPLYSTAMTLIYSTTGDVSFESHYWEPITPKSTRSVQPPSKNYLRSKTQFDVQLGSRAVFNQSNFSSSDTRTPRCIEIGRHKLSCQPNQAYYQTMQSDKKEINLAFSRKPRYVSYVPYTLQDYQRIRPNKYYTLGGLGPANIGTDKWCNGMEKVQRMRQYEQIVKELRV